MSGRRRLGQHIAVWLVGSCLFVAGFLIVPTSSGRAAGTGPALGVYRGAAAPSQVAAFGTWLGKAPSYALDYFADSTWSDIESPDWWLSGWAGSPYTVEYSVPIIPGSGGTLQQGATGAYNSHFTKLAQDLVAHGDGNAILRPGWEFNGNWYRWSAQSDPAAFSAYWRQIVTTMRSVAPNLRFDWSITLGAGIPGGDEAAYPGDAYVDYIGADVYDQAWGPNGAVVSDPATRWNMYTTETDGLNWLSSFAVSHGKPISLAEWGLAIRSDGHGGGDNAYFVQQMYNWITTHNVAFDMYFEYDASDGIHRLMTNEFPIGAATYRQLFGASATATTSSSTASTTSSPATTSTTTTGATTTTPKSQKCNGRKCRTALSTSAADRSPSTPPRTRAAACLRFVATSRPPAWFWVWVRWQLGRGEFKGHAGAAASRPGSAPRLVPTSAWKEFRRFLHGQRVATGYCARR